ncbi:MAG: homocysteine S-methyltransferase family protein [Tissierellaceae bacterium]|nr:dihydropteroate synthase [Tissierellia bacterium]
MGIRERLKKDILIFDGAMGTMLQNRGLALGELPEALNIKSPESIIEIHQAYIEAGSQVITTNTFGANELKLKGSGYSVEEVIQAAVANARKAIGDRNIYIALDIGPIGELLEPMGTLGFEEAYDIFKRQILQGVEAGVDLIVIETMTDLYEIKAAVLAAKENTDLPVFATMSFEENGRTFTGCTPASMAMTLEGLGVDALGINCSLGPKEIGPILEQVLKYSSIPAMVQANAGLPTVVDGKTVYDISAEDYASYGRSFIEKGVRVIGGCCGTTDEYIRDLVEAIKDVEVPEIKTKRFSGVCTPTKPVFIDGVRVIGERINPTGKKLFKAALKKQDIDYILREAIAQVEAGADILDVNVGLPEIDEEKIMVKVIKEIQSILDIPLQIDSTDPRTIESGLRVYNGKAIVNSVNGEDRVLDTLLPLVKKYGAAVVGLTLDERGIPSSAMERYRIAEKIVKRAEEYGIAREDVYIDCLTLTAAAQQEDVEETLKALALVKERLGVKTVLGVSNVSYGLPNRELVNKVFFAAALYEGLDLPIINPLDREMMDTILASNLLWNRDKGGKVYLENYKKIPQVEKSKAKAKANLDLVDIIIKGMRDEARAATQELLTTKEPLDIVNEYIVPTLDLVGDRYEKGEIFLPQLIQSAETVKSSFEVIKESLSRDSGEAISKGKIILATVKGDIHDIGKNIVKVLLENYNYEVIDLGKDVPSEVIVEEAIRQDIQLVGLSALMTTTVKSMEETIAQLKRDKPNIKIMVGGAVLNQDYADMIKADYYAKDAKGAVEIARKFF